MSVPLGLLVFVHILNVLVNCGIPVCIVYYVIREYCGFGDDIVIVWLLMRCMFMIADFVVSMTMLVVIGKGRSKMWAHSLHLRARGFAVFIYLVFVSLIVLMSSFAFFFPQSIIAASHYSLVRGSFSSITLVQFGEFIVSVFVVSVWLFRQQEGKEDTSFASNAEPLPTPHTPLPIFQCSDDVSEPDISIQEPLLPTPTPLPVPLPYFPSDTQVAPTSDGSGIPVVIVSRGSGVPSNDKVVSVAISGESSDSPLKSVTVIDQGVGDQVSGDQGVGDQVSGEQMSGEQVTDNPAATDNQVTNPTIHITTPSSDNSPILCCLCKKNPATMRINPCEEEICSSCAPTGIRCPSCGAPILMIDSIRSSLVCLKCLLIPFLGLATPLFSPINNQCRKHNYFAVNSRHVR